MNDDELTPQQRKRKWRASTLMRRMCYRPPPPQFSFCRQFKLPVGCLFYNSRNFALDAFLWLLCEFVDSVAPGSGVEKEGYKDADEKERYCSPVPHEPLIQIKLANLIKMLPANRQFAVAAVAERSVVFVHSALSLLYFIFNLLPIFYSCLLHSCSVLCHRRQATTATTTTTSHFDRSEPL